MKHIVYMFIQISIGGKCMDEYDANDIWQESWDYVHTMPKKNISSGEDVILPEETTHEIQN